MRLIVSILLLVSLTSVAEHKAFADEFSCATSAIPLTSEIQKEGAKTTLRSVYSSGYWQAFLKCVAGGDKRWVTIATSFRGVSDGATDELNSVIGEALGNQPEIVLTIAPPVFSLDEICSAPDVDDPRFNSYELSIKEIRHRKLALHKVHRKNLLKDVATCQKDLEEAKADAARFYKK